MEQLEIQLHPMAQANLADAFISAVQSYENGVPRETQLIVETHSEHFLTRLQRRVAERVIEADDVAVYFVRHGAEQAKMEPLRLNMFGEIENWPESFSATRWATSPHALWPPSNVGLRRIAHECGGDRHQRVAGSE